jgi:hypothetical protein
VGCWGAGECIRSHVVDRLLALLHPPHVISERDVLCFGAACHNSKAHELRELLAIGGIVDEALLQNLAEGVSERRVFVLLLCRKILEPAEGALDAAVPDRLHVARFLK